MKNTDQAKLDEYFKSNINNLISFAKNKFEVRFSAFLDERQQLIATELLNAARFKSYEFFGGMGNCERIKLGVFPETELPDEALFPIKPLMVTFSDKLATALSHRDFLGALMGLQIKREAIGDILIEDNHAIIFADNDIAEFILLNLDKVGKIGVRVTYAVDINIEKKLSYEEITGTVSSMRLDCIVALLLNKSRTIAVEAIEKGLVKLNCIDVQNISKQINSGDVIVIRGKGKFIVGNDIKKTKKDRLFITINKLV